MCMKIKVLKNKLIIKCYGNILNFGQCSKIDGFVPEYKKNIEFSVFAEKGFIWFLLRFKFYKFEIYLGFSSFLRHEYTIWFIIILMFKIFEVIWNKDLYIKYVQSHSSWNIC